MYEEMLTVQKVHTQLAKQVKLHINGINFFFLCIIENLTKDCSGLHHLSRVLAHHLGKRNITSNTIACGPFESKMMAATLAKFKDELVSSIPLNRIGTPEDVAGTCLFLSSRAGSYVNGATITLEYVDKTNNSSIPPILLPFDNAVNEANKFISYNNSGGSVISAKM